MKDNIWLQTTPEEAAALREALAGSDDPAAASILAKIDLLTTDRDHDEAFREAAIEKYVGKLSDGDLDFQSDAMVSNGEEGAYVMAFLYVRNDEAGLNFDDEDEPEADGFDETTPDF